MSEVLKKSLRRGQILIEVTFSRYPIIKKYLKKFLVRFPKIMSFLKRLLGKNDFPLSKMVIRKRHWEGSSSSELKRKLLFAPLDLLFSGEDFFNSAFENEQNAPFRIDRIRFLLPVGCIDRHTQRYQEFLREALEQRMGIVCEKIEISAVDDLGATIDALADSANASLFFVHLNLIKENTSLLSSDSRQIIIFFGGKPLLMDPLSTNSVGQEPSLQKRGWPEKTPAIAFSKNDVERLRSEGFLRIVPFPIEDQSIYDILRIHPDEIQKNDLQMNSPNIIFVGPLQESSRLFELIDAFQRLRYYMDMPVQLHLIGRSLHDHYMENLRKRIKDADLVDFITIVESDNRKTVRTFFSVADLAIFLDPSLIENILTSFVCDTPTLLYRGEGALSFFRGNGAMLKTMNPEDLARMMAILLTNPDYAAQIVASQREILKQTSQDAAVSRLSKLFDLWNLKWERNGSVAHSSAPCVQDVLWQMEGPFDSTYSLALVNRETARALALSKKSMALFSTDGKGDYLPDTSFLARYYPEILSLWKSGENVQGKRVHFVSRNVYPPRTSAMKGESKIFQQFAWEETGIPLQWVRSFNYSLNGMAVVSHHVRKVLLDQGVTVPVWVSGMGVDHWERVISDQDYSLDAKGFRFLHVSSCLPRKAADVMLKAFGKSFRKSDDVSLVIKTFPNYRNDIPQLVDRLREQDPDFPHVVLILEDLSPAKLKALYEKCDVLVAPSRAEGFGLPIAEAMLSGLPPITTAWGGQMDFCDQENAWLIDFDFDWAEEHPEFKCFNSVWAEPREADLVRALREAWATPKEDLRNKAWKGRKSLLELFTWGKVVDRMTTTANTLSQYPLFPKIPRVGLITTWNVPCGIATHAEHLLTHFPADVAILANCTKETISEDTPNVRRCWDQDDQNPMSKLSMTIDQLNLDAIIIQFQYGFFNFRNLGLFIEEQRRKRKLIYIVLHSTTDWVDGSKRLSELSESFSMCQRLIVHSIRDLNRLKGLKLIDNVVLFPPGVNLKTISPQVKSSIFRQRFVIASYGFFMPHKGFIELLEAVNLLVQSGLDVHLLMVTSEYPDPKSSISITNFRERMDALGMGDRLLMETGFLSDEESLGWLTQADLIVFPYQNATDSSSGAVRVGISSGKPVAVTPLPMFQDVSSVTLQLPGTTPKEMAMGIEKLIPKIRENSEEVLRLLELSANWKTENSFAVSAEKMFNFLRSDMRENQIR